ncbi:hypothetical protein BDR03DRAFT_1016621 [Suillus americanus]|nr:hypothetical protein BDR03DRAFT_1016621 [Suillus americanus]
MKVFPTFSKEQTFSLSELVSAVEFIRTQNATHHVDDETVCIKGELLSGCCPACGTYTRYQQSPADAVSSGDNEPTAAITIEAPSANPATQTGPTLPTVTEPAAISANGQTTLVGAAAGTSTSSRWYVVTVGCETGVFQGWHNVHQHVVGVPGACFGRHSSLSNAQAAYAEAVKDGGVMEVLL